jgi:hypothetical protein
MSKASIVIIIICTAIIAAVVFFTLKEEPGMEDIYLVSHENIEEASPEEAGVTDFHGRDSSIYVIIQVKDVKTGDLINIEWVYMDDDSHEIIQKDCVEIDIDGSGKLAVYFLKRDSAYYPGKYKVRAEYNGTQEREEQFTIVAD